MWFPQFKASRFETDMKRAQDFGCQGVLGIHWRTRIIDPTTTYLARASWDSQLSATTHYRNFCAPMASGARAAELATLFDQCDRNRAISSTFLGTYDQSGFANTLEIAGDYSEAFDYAETEPDLAVLPAQRVTAEKLRQLVSSATSPLERDRIGYFAGFVGFMVPYCDAYEKAHQLNAVLKQAVELRAKGEEDAARAQVAQQAVPLWLTMAPLVRSTMLEYQSVIATRSDQGQLASMQNKFVRISLERLRLSIKEFLNELPPEMDQAYADAVSPDAANPPRVFIPTRPSLLKPGESSRIFIIAPGQGEVAQVKLHTRRQNTQEWQTSAATHAGRSVYTATIGPFHADDGAIEYFATAATNSELLYDPPQAPNNVYTLNIIV
jgi:hypothetical protein